MNELAWTLAVPGFLVLAFSTSQAVGQGSALELAGPNTVSAESTLPSVESVTESLNSVDAAYKALSENAESFQLSFAHVKQIVQVVRPSVVHIEALKSLNNGQRSIEETGAGVLFEYNERTFVLTNRHVVDQAKHNDIRVQLADGRFFSPIRSWTDRGSDLAVLETDAPNLQVGRIGTSDNLEIGDFVVAIGSPFGLNHSASYGIISAKGRRDLQLGDDGVRYQDFLQTDAAINPGNSGGPLMNLAGEVVGINTAIASNSGANEGVGFAIPIDMAMKIARDLIDEGTVARAFLGVSLDNNYAPETALQLGLNTIYGARVAAVTPGSPADAAELVVGDVIMRVDDRVIENDSHLVHVVSMTPIGSVVAIDVFRDGEMTKVRAVVSDRKSFDPRN